MSATPIMDWYGRHEAAKGAAPAPAAKAPPGEVPRISPEALLRLIEAGQPLTIIDVRRESGYVRSGRRIPDAVRLTVDEIQEHLAEIPRGAPVVLYCA